MICFYKLDVLIDSWLIGTVIGLDDKRGKIEVQYGIEERFNRGIVKLYKNCFDLNSSNLAPLYTHRLNYVSL